MLEVVVVRCSVTLCVNQTTKLCQAPDKNCQASVRLTLINDNDDHMQIFHKFRVLRQFFCFFLRRFALLIACVMQLIKCLVFASINLNLLPLICVATLSCVRCTTITFRGNIRTKCDDAAAAVCWCLCLQFISFTGLKLCASSALECELSRLCVRYSLVPASVV